MQDNTEAMNLNGIKILVAEDDAYSALIAQEMLSFWNATVDLVENGKDAVDKVRENTYDIVLMDLQMPVLDGFQAMSQIRTFNTTVPIVVLTATADTAMEQLPVDTGLSGYLIKPYSPPELYNAVIKYATKR